MKPLAAGGKLSPSLLSRLFVIAVLVLHPIVISPDTYRNITATKLYFYLGVSALFFLLLPISRALQPDAVPLGASLRSLRFPHMMLLGYWFVLLVSAMLSASPARSLWNLSGRPESWLMMTVYLLSCLLISRCYSLRQADFTAMCTAACLVAAYGILQYYGLDFLHLNPAPIAHVQGPDLLYVSTMSNRNVASTYFCLAFCLSSAFYFRSGSKKSWAFLGISWILFYTLILGQTESGYVALFVSFGLLFPFLCRSSHELSRIFIWGSGCFGCLWIATLAHRSGWPASPWAPGSNWYPVLMLCFAFLSILTRRVSNRIFFAKKRQILLWYLFLVLFLVVIVLMVPQLAQHSNHKLVQAANQILMGNVDDSLGSYRIFIWRRSVSMFLQRPLLGYGPDGLYAAFSDRFHEDLAAAGLKGIDKAHNEYLQTLVEAGILGAALLLLFYASVIKKLASASRDNTFSAALLFALGCYCVQAFFNISTPIAHPIVWCLWGIAVSHICPKPPQTPVAPSPA